MYQINGVKPKKITYGGQAVKKVTCNGVVVWSAQSPDDPYLLNYSDQKTATTGGWGMDNIGGYAYFQSWQDNWNAWRMSYSGNNWSYGRGWMYTKKKVNISGWNKLTLTYRWEMGYGDAEKSTGSVIVVLSNSQGWPFLLNDNKDDNGPDLVRRAYKWNNTASGTYALEMNVSDVDGEYYILLTRYNSTNAATFTTGFQTLILS